MAKFNNQQERQDTRQSLNSEILKCFSTETSAKLQENLEIRTLSPDKVGLKFKTEIGLNESEKGRLRECIRTVYGHAIQIVQMPKFKVVDATKPPEITIKLQMPTAEDTAQRGSKTAVNLSDSGVKWEAVKNDIINALLPNTVDRMKAVLNQVSVLHLSKNKLRLRARDLTINKLKDNQSTIEKAAAKNDVDIEIEDITDNDIAYFPWTYPSQDLPPLTLENLKH